MVTIDTPVVAQRPAPADLDELVVVVTLEDIREGEMGYADSCAIARAANRVLPEGYWTMMNTDGSGLEVRPADDFKPVLSLYSASATAWAKRFDRDRDSVAPERFVFVRRT